MNRAELAARYCNSIVVEWHEAAHAVVARHFGWEIERDEVNRIGDGGETRMARGYWGPWERLCVLVAGEVGERRSAAWDDRFRSLSAGDDARGIAAALDELGWESPASAEQAVEEILFDSGGGLRRVADALRHHRSLSGRQVAELLG